VGAPPGLAGTAGLVYLALRVKFGALNNISVSALVAKIGMEMPVFHVEMVWFGITS